MKLLNTWATGSILAAVAMGAVGGCGGGAVKQEFRPTGTVTRFDVVGWQKVLDAVATPDGYVRYAVLTENRGGVRDELFRFVGLIGAVSPENRPELFPTPADRLAYWINAYNALCMYGVYERGLPGNTLSSLPPGALYLVDSFSVGGKSYSLDTIEKRFVRSAGDPRVHFALNCMSHSCPPLRQEAYAGDKLEAQLADQGHRYLSDPRAAVRDGDKVRLNSIFVGFYKDDFTAAYARKTGAAKAELLESIRGFAAPGSPVLGATGYSDMGYDWSLNRVP